MNIIGIKASGVKGAINTFDAAFTQHPFYKSGGLIVLSQIVKHTITMVTIAVTAV